MRVLSDPPHQWAYRSSAGRDLRIDMLRGCAVVIMFIDHLAGPSALYLLSAGGHFATSAAEAFVFISGFVTAVVYGRTVRVHGLRTGCRRLLRRALVLYALSVTLTLLVLPVSEHFGAGPCPSCQPMGIDFSNPVQLVWNVVTLQQTYYLVDIPLLYTRLLLMAPIGLILLSAGGTWLVVVLSVGIWATYHLDPTHFVLGWSVSGNWTFHLAAWQVIFFGGMVLGFHRQRLRMLIRPEMYRLWLLAAAAGCAGLLVAYSIVGHGASADAVRSLFDKPGVGPGRLVASAVVFTGAFLAVHTFWIPARRALGWLLIPLGQHGLYAYTVHVMLALLLVIVQGLAGVWVTGTPGIDLALQVGAVALVWLGIRYRLTLGGGQVRASVVSITRTRLEPGVEEHRSAA